MYEFDNLLANKNWNSKTIGEFFKALKDYNDDDKCIITAEVAKELLKRGGKSNISSAETILIYATQKCFDVSDSNYKAQVYYLLGQLYELHIENFVKAYTYYEKYTDNNTVNEGNHSTILRALILRDDFTYSEKLEEELKLSFGELDLGLKNDRIYENIGRLIVAQHNNDEEKIAALTKHLKAIVKADELFFLDFIFKKDNIPDSLKVPPKVINFIKELTVDKQAE